MIIVAGNFDYLECGTVANGKCAGDTWWGYGVYIADNKDGCRKEGNGGGSALYRRIEVIGKCASKCRLGRSSATYDSLVNNNGFSNRIVKDVKEPTLG